MSSSVVYCDIGIARANRTIDTQNTVMSVPPHIVWVSLRSFYGKKSKIKNTWTHLMNMLLCGWEGDIMWVSKDKKRKITVWEEDFIMGLSLQKKWPSRPYNILTHHPRPRPYNIGRKKLRLSVIVCQNPFIQRKSLFITWFSLLYCE